MTDEEFTDAELARAQAALDLYPEFVARLRRVPNEDIRAALDALLPPEPPTVRQVASILRAADAEEDS
jgi:hypothetical protein